MTLHLGKVKPGSTIYLPFDTFAGATGASITMSGLATSDILIFKNGSTTQRASTTGYTLLDTDGIDFDGVTGIHGISIDLSSNATADFYTAGGMYWVVISTITIDGQTVSFVLATFTIGYEGAILDTTIATLSSQTSFTLTAGPAEDDAINGCEVVIHDIASAVQVGRAFVSDYTGSTRTVTLVAGTTFTAAAGDNISVFLSALQPTVQGRALDVSAGGEAGIDWANIGSPTTAQNLSATNIDVDQVVASVSGAVGSVTGNVGGNVTGSVGSVATNGITAASIATGAIDADAIADNAIDAGAIASGAITATKFAANAIDAAALAADAVAEIQSGLSTLNAAGVRSAIGLASANLDTQLDALPTAAEIADALWDEDATGHQTQGTFGQAIGDPGADSDTIWALANTNLDATVSSRLATAGYTTPPTAAQNADAVWDETLADHLGAGSTGAALNAAGSAGDPWTTALPGAYGAGSAGNIIGNNLNATVSSRLPTASYTAPDNATIATIQSDTNDIQTRLPAALVSGRMDSSVGAMAADTLTSSAVAASAVTELQAGLSTLTAAQVNTEVDTALADVGLTTTITGRIDVATSTRLASASYTAPDNATISTINTKLGTPAGASVSADIAAIEAQTDDIGAGGAGLTAIPWNAAWDTEVQSEVVDGLTQYGASTFAGGAVASVTGNVGGNVAGSVGSVTSPVTVGTNNDKTGYALTAGERTSIADALLTRDLSAVAGAASRSLLNALRAIRNRVAVAAGVMTVYQEDDSTTAWTAAVTTDASADPVTQIDPS